MKVRVLGSGTSSGVPRIGQDWGACDPANPRNRRMRAAILVESATTRILIDTGPDMREQLLAAGVSTLDAVIWTHDHADHTHGIDDLRQVFHAMGRPVRGLARPALKDTLMQRFRYVFAGRDGYPPTVAIEPLPDAITIGDITVRVVDQPHGPFTSVGLRFENEAGSIGYATDLSAMTLDMATLYQGLDIWIVDALRRWPHPSHPDLPTVLDWIAEFKPGRAVLTHMDQSMDYATLVAELPAGVEPGYDGLELCPVNDTTMDVIYVALLLILPVSALVARRLPLAETLKMALAWVAIFGLLFALVSLWQEATGAGSMLGAMFR